MAMNKIRKTINLNDIEGFDSNDIKYLYAGEPCLKTNLLLSDEEVEGYDSEKRFQRVRVIFEKHVNLSDSNKVTGEFYEGEVTDWGMGEKEYETTLTQVFPREITKLIYE